MRTRIIPERLTCVHYEALYKSTFTLPYNVTSGSHQVGCRLRNLRSAARQRSKGARSFRDQKILNPGHPQSGGSHDGFLRRVNFFLKKADDIFSRRPQNTGRQRR